MTIICNDCKCIPMMYFTIDGSNFCGRCKRRRFELELDELKEKYNEVI